MKTQSRTFIIIVAATVAIVATVSFRAFGGGPCPQDTGKWKFKKPLAGPGPDQYAEFKPGKGQTDLDRELIKLKNNGGDFCIRFLSKANGKPEDPYVPRDHKLGINTDRVTKSKVASSIGSDASAANDPNAVYHLYSNASAADFDPVLALFK